MAGTGKSTVSRTVSQSFDEKGDLGATFFFKRGERGRGDAALLFTTLASQLVSRTPALAPHIRAAIEADRALPSKTLKDQFENLILKPLGNLKVAPSAGKGMILVIDALDECERYDDVRAIIHLLSRAKELSSVRLRAFVTSRPELPIRLGFSDISGKYQDLVPHEIPRPILEHDITAFLEHRLSDIKENHNRLGTGAQQLPPSWPGPEAVRDLVQMAVPLFISAATICRFIEDSAWSDPSSSWTRSCDIGRERSNRKSTSWMLPIGPS